jgi:hypothetical protein
MITGTISFRSLLVGRVEEFVSSTDFNPLVTQKSLTELVSTACNYTEEGQSFTPAIYATSCINQLLKLIPGSMHIKIGGFSSIENSLCAALKKCAPLAVDGWCIYICYKDSSTTYGLFSDSQFPLNIPLEETLLNVGEGVLKVLKVQQSAPNCVELANHKGDRHTIYLSDKKESETSPRVYINELSQIICSKISDKERPPLQTLLEKTLTDGLDSSHGALIAVITDKTPPKFLNDGIILQEPIDLAHLVNQAREHSTEDCLKLSAFTKILKGMFNCDGIIVFSPYAKIIGYNSFVKSSSKAAPVAGGARKRAFAALESKINHGICAAYIRSHDGWSKLNKSEKI